MSSDLIVRQAREFIIKARFESQLLLNLSYQLTAVDVWRKLMIRRMLCVYLYHYRNNQQIFIFANFLSESQKRKNNCESHFLKGSDGGPF